MPHVREGNRNGTGTPAEAYYGRGTSLATVEDYDAAIKDFSEPVIRLNPKMAKAHRDRGIAHSEKSQMPQLLSDLTEAIRLDPKDALTYAFRGSIRLSGGEYDPGIADLT